MGTTKDILQDPDRLDPWAELPALRTWCKIGGRTAIPQKGIVSISAKRKQGKSYFTYALATALLGNGFGNIQADKRPNSFLIFDTEMDKATLQSRMRSVLRIIGKDNEAFNCFPILEVDKDKRFEFIKNKVDLYNPEIIVIDGIADLIQDFNNAEQSLALMEAVLQISVNRTVIAIIHQNKADENMRGHLGTNLGNKAAENYTVSKSGRVFTAKCTDSRFSDTDNAPEFKFAVDADGNLSTTESIFAEVEENKRMEMCETFSKIFGEEPDLNYSRISEKIQTTSKCKERTARNLIEEAKSLGIIKKKGLARTAPYILVRS